MKIKVHTKDQGTTTIHPETKGLGDRFLVTVGGKWYEVTSLEMGATAQEAEAWCEPIDPTTLRAQGDEGR